MIWICIPKTPLWMLVWFIAAKHSLSHTTKIINSETDASLEPAPTAWTVDERNHGQKAEKLFSDRAVTTTGPDDEDADKPQRPMSPGTLALMCDEKEPLFTAPPSPIGGLASEELSTSGSPQIALLHAEQERAILLEFRDCLRRITSVGNRRGMVLGSFLMPLSFRMHGWCFFSTSRFYFFDKMGEFLYILCLYPRGPYLEVATHMPCSQSIF